MSPPLPTPDFRDPPREPGPGRPVDPAWPLAVAAQVVALEQVAAVEGQLRALEGDLSVEAVHALRVACRRLRTAMDSLKPVWGARRLRPLRRELAALSSACGRTRDLDVEMARWARRAGGHPHDERERALRWLWSRADGARRGQQGRMQAALATARGERLIPRLRAFFSTHPVDLAAFEDTLRPFGPIPDEGVSSPARPVPEHPAPSDAATTSPDPPRGEAQSSQDVAATEPDALRPAPPRVVA